MVVSVILWALYLVLSRPATQRHGALEMTAWSPLGRHAAHRPRGRQGPGAHGLGRRVARRVGVRRVRQRVHHRGRLLSLVPRRRADRPEPRRRLRQLGAGGGSGGGLDMAGRDGPRWCRWRGPPSFCPAC